MVNAVEGLCGAFGRVNVVTFVFGALVVVGLVLAWRRLDRAALRTSRVLPIALLVGSVVFVALSGWSRAVAFHPDYAHMSRYVDVSVALALPAIGVGIDALIRRWRLLAPVFVAGLVAVVPFNLWELHRTDPRSWSDIQTPYRRGFVTLAEVPAIHDAPRSMLVDDALHILANATSIITVGWLLDAKAAGKLPLIHPTARERARATIGLLLRQSSLGFVTNCRTLRTTITRRLDTGDSFAFTGGRLDISGTYPPSGNETSSGPIRFDLVRGREVTATKGPMKLVLSPVPGPPTRVCDGLVHDTGA
jgi:hypothetical protein